MSKYVERVLKETAARNGNEPEFLQAVDEVLTTLDPVLKKNPSMRPTRFSSAWSSRSA